MKREYEDGKITVVSDEKWHNFKYQNEVPKKVMEREFDWMKSRGDDYQDGFFKYRDWWYHYSEFIRFDQGSPMEVGAKRELAKDWQSYKGDSYFSGIVLTISDDGEQYKVGTYLS